MTRVKRGVVARKKHKKILKMARGYYGARSKVFRVAKQAVIKSLQYSYRDRRCKKRVNRNLWILNINAYLNNSNLSYNKFIYLVKKNDITLNRKIMCFLFKKNHVYLDQILAKLSAKL